MKVEMAGYKRVKVTIRGRMCRNTSNGRWANRTSCGYKAK